MAYDDTCMHLLQIPSKRRRAAVGRVVFQVSVTVSLQYLPYLSYFIHFTIYLRFPKSNELLKKWSLAIGTEKKIARWSLICSRHFKEDDFRHSLFGNNRYLKQEAIPSLYLNGENNDDMVLDNRGTIVKENQPTNTVAEYSERDPENKTLNITGSHVRVERDDNLFKR